jgi:outer membrane immunogenic protein
MLRGSRSKALLLCTSALLVLGGGAYAADPQLPAEAPSGFNWGGAYVGAGVGVGAVVHRFEVTNVLSVNGIGGEGLFGEVIAGYDHMLSDRVLLGGFIDAHFGNIGPAIDASSGGVSAGSLELTNSYGFDAGARLGYLVAPSTLAYVLGGYGWQHFKLDGSIPGGPAISASEDRSGYILGVGMETAVSGNWTLKTEYRYSDYGNDTIADGTALRIQPSTHTFHVGANYRFGAQNGGGVSFAAPAYDWTGFYVGGALGAGAVVHDLSLNLGPVSADANGVGGEGVFGEANVGYDHDFGTWVAGVMLDARYSGISTDINVPALGFDAKLEADYGFDVLARAGMKVNESTLAYVLGGYSWQHFDLNAAAGGAPSTSLIDWDSSGFSLGGGLETAVTDNVTVGLEYRYTQFADKDFSAQLGAPPGTVEVEPSFHTARLGLKYKFN